MSFSAPFAVQGAPAATEADRSQAAAHGLLSARTFLCVRLPARGNAAQTPARPLPRPRHRRRCVATARDAHFDTAIDGLRFDPHG
jgi:hypothetical protein